MISLKLCRNSLIRLLVVLALISSFLNVPAYSQESEDSQIFITGFNAFQQKDYATTVTKMNEVLKKHPDSPLRDMVLFWLSRAHFKNGNRLEAARYMSQFSKEYPDNPLKSTVDEELLSLASRYDRGELSAAAVAPAAQKAGPKALSAQSAGEERLADANAEKEKLARQKSEQERLLAEQRERDRIAALKAEDDRQAAEKAAIARRAAEEAEKTRLAAQQSERDRAALVKAEADRQTAEKAALQKAEKENIDMALVARQQAEMVRLSLAKTEQKRLAALKAEEEREAAEKAVKAEQKRVAAATAEKERVAAEAEEKRIAALKAAEDRVSAEKGERLRLEREKIELERKTAAAAESARLAAVQKEQERKAAEKAQADQVAREQAAVARRAAKEAEQGRLALQKAEQERIAEQRKEKERQATVVAAGQQATPVRDQALPVVVKGKPGQGRGTSDRSRSSKDALREKAIAQYKSIIAQYPDSKAAASAAAKLKELGVAVATPQAAPGEPLPENAQVLRLEVAQLAGLEFNLSARSQAYPVSQRITIPFEVINRGNGTDSFYLESGFPVEFSAGFAAASQPDQPLNQTPQLAPGESFKGLVSLVIPSASIDGLRISHPLKVSSRLLSEVAQSREVSLTASAPLLRAIVKAEKTQLAPGDKTVCRVTVLNVGSTAARGVTLRLNYPPQMEPLDFAAAGFRQEMKAALVQEGLQIKSGERREFTFTFQLKDDSLAGQELLSRAELIDIPLHTAAVFVSNAVHVQPQHGIQVRIASDRQVVIPGQTLLVPLVVTNTGNLREKFRIAQTVKGAGGVLFFQDLNRDGVRQAAEPVITEVGPLAPKEEAGVVMEIATPRSAADGSQGSAGAVFSSEGDAARSSAVETRFVYARPVLQMTMAARDGRLKPGEVTSFDLTIYNRGSNLARVVELQGAWPDQLELVAAEPASSSARNGALLWNFSEVGAGEKRTIKVSFRVKPGTSVGTNIQVKNLLSYEDQLGNRY